MTGLQQITDLGQKLQTRFQEIATAEALRFIGGNFAAQGYQGAGFIRWAARKSTSKKNAGRAILVKSGRLKRGWRGRNSAPGEVTIGNDVPYAEIHNNGGTINKAARSETFLRNRYVKGAKKGMFKKGSVQGKGFSFKEHGVTMPRRQMMPTNDSDSPVLRAAIERDLRQEIAEFEKQFNA